MFIVLLRFGDAKANAPQFMAAHKAWIERGFADGVFLTVGSIETGLGGAILACDTSREAIEKRVAADPFVVERIVTPEIIEIRPARTDPRLGFLVPT